MLIDIERDSKVEGWSYRNAFGLQEVVLVGGRCDEDCADIITIRDSTCANVEIYVQDIPRLIKALECAYEHLNKEDNE